MCVCVCVGVVVGGLYIVRPLSQSNHWPSWQDVDSEVNWSEVSGTIHRTLQFCHGTDTML